MIINIAPFLLHYAVCNYNLEILPLIAGVTQEMLFSLDVNNRGSNLFGKFGIVLCESSLSWLEGSHTGSDLMKDGSSREERTIGLLGYTLQGNLLNLQG